MIATAAAITDDLAGTVGMIVGGLVVVAFAMIWQRRK